MGDGKAASSRRTPKCRTGQSRSGEFTVRSELEFRDAANKKGGRNAAALGKTRTVTWKLEYQMIYGESRSFCLVADWFQISAL